MASFHETGRHMVIQQLHHYIQCLLTRPPIHKRFLSDQPRRTAAFLQAAKEYVGKLDDARYSHLYEKPFDRLFGPPSDPALLHGMFYQDLYQVTNLLRAMEVPFGGRMLEVGSGPGWVTEILLGLGYAVDGIDPSEDMVRLANERVQCFFQHHRIKDRPHVNFHCCTLESCKLAASSFDAIFLHAALHHVIDEDKGLAQCFRLLKPGGILGINEACWQPGNREFEAALEEEMARFGTLENPFTIEYLDYLLKKHGFIDVERYHGINGLFPVSMEKMSLKDAAQSPASASNALTARKPEPNHWRGPTTADFDAETCGIIDVLDAKFDKANAHVCLRLRLHNCGQTAWLNKPGVPGSVTLALYRGEHGHASFEEAAPRHRLPAQLLPGEEWVGELVYHLPATTSTNVWQLGLVSEHLFWFSQHGSPAVPLTVPG